MHGLFPASFLTHVLSYVMSRQENLIPGASKEPNFASLLSPILRHTITETAIVSGELSMPTMT